jgi:AAA domain
LIRSGMTSAELAKREFPPPKWIVPGLIPEGLGILAGKPKTGKSFQLAAITGKLRTRAGDRQRDALREHPCLRAIFTKPKKNAPRKGGWSRGGNQLSRKAIYKLTAVSVKKHCLCEIPYSAFKVGLAADYHARQTLSTAVKSMLR